MSLDSIIPYLFIQLAWFGDLLAEPTQFKQLFSFSILPK